MIGEVELEILKTGQVKPVKEISNHPRARTGEHDELAQIGMKDMVGVERDIWGGMVIGCYDSETLKARALRKDAPNDFDVPCDGSYFQIRDLAPCEVQQTTMWRAHRRVHI
jgi:hypothetical protein